MPVSIEALGIDRLSVRERLELIEVIWDSLPEHVNPDEVPPWHLAELAKRRGGRRFPECQQAMARGSSAIREWVVSLPVILRPAADAGIEKNHRRNGSG